MLCAGPLRGEGQFSLSEAFILKLGLLSLNRVEKFVVLVESDLSVSLNFKLNK